MPDTKAVRERAAEIRFSLPGAPPSLANQRLHWRAKKAVTDEWKTNAYYAAYAARVLAKEPMSIVPDRSFKAHQRRVVITMHRCRQLDTDNAYAAVKPILDGLKRQLIVDDAPQFCDLAVRQVRVRHKAEEHVEITVSIIEALPEHLASAAS